MKVIIVVVLLVVVSVTLAEEMFRCEDDVPYMENDCNGCFCSKGELGCTLMGCTTHDDPKYKDCTVGTEWKKDCNRCWCVEKIGTLCTAKKCD